jgi:hypothetical protein
MLPTGAAAPRLKSSLKSLLNPLKFACIPDAVNLSSGARLSINEIFFGHSYA